MTSSQRHYVLFEGNNLHLVRHGYLPIYSSHRLIKKQFAKVGRESTKGEEAPGTVRDHIPTEQDLVPNSGVIVG